MVRKYFHFSFLSLRNPKGFTLIELIVVGLILGVMAVAVILMIAPQHQYDKVKDARRKHDLQQIKTALDTYYQDYNCYPRTLPFGSEWRAGSVVYMKEVPEDPDCHEDNNLCYRYQVDENDACPSWNVLYVRTETTLATGSTQDEAQCPLTQFDNCVPYGGINQMSCVISGTPDCQYISTSDIPVSYPQEIGETGGANPTPTSAVCDGASYVCTANGCNFGTSGGVTFCSQQACEAFCN